MCQYNERPRSLPLCLSSREPYLEPRVVININYIWFDAILRHLLSCNNSHMVNGVHSSQVENKHDSKWYQYNIHTQRAKLIFMHVQNLKYGSFSL
jgi:hypothetical protein